MPGAISPRRRFDAGWTLPLDLWNTGPSRGFQQGSGQHHPCHSWHTQSFSFLDFFTVIWPNLDRNNHFQLIFNFCIFLSTQLAFCPTYLWQCQATPPNLRVVPGSGNGQSLRQLKALSLSLSLSPSTLEGIAHVISIVLTRYSTSKVDHIYICKCVYIL